VSILYFILYLVAKHAVLNLCAGSTEKREKAIQALKEVGRVKQAEKLIEMNDEAKMRKCIKCMKGIMFWIAIFHRYYTVQRTIKEQVINKSRKTIDTKIVNTVYD